jgi:iron complex outermembrane receptor protein
MQSSCKRASSTRRVAFLLGTASFASLAAVATAQAQQVAQAQMAQATETPPEEVLITGSLIRGTVAVGAPVTTLGQADFAQAGVVSVGDLLTTLPAFENHAAPSTAAASFGNFINRLNIHNLNGVDSRTLMLIDGMKMPPQGTGAIQYDPSIIPSLALDRVDVLADGASATYGSEAVAGVVNLILKRGYEGATLQTVVGSGAGGAFNWDVQGLYGKTWSGGDVTVSLERGSEQPLNASKRSYYTQDFTPWGLDNATPVVSATPGIVSIGAPATATGATTTLAALCANCYSIPTGQNGVGLSWAQIAAHPGVGNIQNPTAYQTIIPADQWTSSTITFDQDVLPWLQFNAEGYYSNRRDQTTNPDVGVTSGAIPTSNTFYPTGTLCTTNPSTAIPAGIPAGCTPNNLRVSYIYNQIPNIESASEISDRYTFGFTAKLPAEWQAKIFGGISDEEVRRTDVSNLRLISPNNVNAALGATIAATPASNNSPGVPSFTKPANIPYLNLFCDPTAFSCIDPATLRYIKMLNSNNSGYIEHEAGVNFDGPLFDLPGGTVRAAIGGDYTYEDYWIRTTTEPVTSQVDVTTPDNLWRTVKSGFAQVNVPLVGEANKLPFVERLELEISGRYDSYDDFGNTFNPRFSADWTIGEGVTLRSSYGTNFVAPSFKSLSSVLARNITPWNVGGVNTSAISACPPGATTPAPGSVAAQLNPTCSAALNNPIGIQVGSSGGSGGLAGFLRPPDYKTEPEKAKNWVLGFEYAPTNFLKGLDFQVTWWRVQINGPITGTSPSTGNGLNDPNTRFLFILPGDPQFATAVNYALTNPLAGSNVSGINPASVKWIEDGSARNLGSKDTEGLDFVASYDWDMGSLGAWNAGVTGSYFFHDFVQNLPNTPEVDTFHDTTTGETRAEKLRYRARLGWSDGSFSITGFMDYQSHVYSTNQLPSAAVLASFPNLVANPFLLNLVPSSYLFDISLGYNTGTTPANDYLKNINVFLTVNNIMDRQPQFQYGGVSNAYAYYPSGISPIGRNWRLGITKQF